MKTTIKYILALLLFGPSLHLSAQTSRIDALLDRFTNHPEQIMVAAHRCAHQNYPENSIAALQETIRLGIDIAEIDIRETKDKVLVIMHDDKVDRTTNGKGLVSDFTYAELKKLRLLHNGKPTEEQVPSLEELLAVAKGNLLIDIDFKLKDEDALRRTYALIAQSGTADQILFFLYKYQYTPMLHALNQGIKIMPRVYSKKDTEKVLAMGIVKVLHIDESFYAEDLMQAIQQQKVRIWSNALGEYDDMEAVTRGSGFSAMLQKYKYVNVIQTNLPEELMAYLKGIGKHP